MEANCLYEITRNDVRTATGRLDLMTAGYELLNRQMDTLNVPSIVQVNLTPQIIVAVLLHRLEELGDKVVSDNVKKHFADVKARSDQRRKDWKL